MKKRVMAASAVVCTVCVLGVVCIKTMTRTSPLSGKIWANVEALTENEYINVLTCYSTYRVTPNNPNGEPIWKIIDCDGCASVLAYEYRDSGLCTQNNGGIYVK